MCILYYIPSVVDYIHFFYIFFAKIHLFLCFLIMLTNRSVGYLQGLRLMFSNEFITNKCVLMMESFSTLGKTILKSKREFNFLIPFTQTPSPLKFLLRMINSTIYFRTLKLINIYYIYSYIGFFRSFN